MKLYEIDMEIDRLIGMSSDEDISYEDIKDTLDALVMDKYDKCVNVALKIKELLSDAERFKNEEEKINRRRRQIERKSEWLKNYLAVSLRGEKIDNDPRVKVGYRHSTAVKIDDASLLPNEFIVVRPVELRPDKDAIKKALLSGEDVQGAHLEEKCHIQVS